MVVQVRLLCVGLLTSCDPERKRKCEWYLVPELDHMDQVEGNWVTLCARNYTTRKQRCYLKAPLEFAEKIYGKTFRLVDLEYEKKPRPRKIIRVKTCTPDKEQKKAH